MKPTAVLIMNIGILSFLSIPDAMGSPGGTYTLSGNEKSVREIIKADVEKYPDLYMGEPLGAYLSEFKKVASSAESVG